ncbi:hypothetical protein BT96DRAFT_292799 [Gymnopus androsaceus JB14]|uniref:Uncharacterized protein n=1 Tax=Gymnopus androsaceus JB14 TaxID=1447944 RepID=A0A6A4I7V2_9AGAR|nr:hypothetical protein BT96DRAFT_292799 [Gymnopus androsaceus JB14]
MADHGFGSKWSSISVKISSSLELIVRVQTLAQESQESADKATALLQEVMEVVAAQVAGEAKGKERAQVETSSPNRTTLLAENDVSMVDDSATTHRLFPQLPTHPPISRSSQTLTGTARVNCEGCQ